jgi:hypothetical protein
MRLKLMRALSQPPDMGGPAKFNDDIIEFCRANYMSYFIAEA